MTSLRDSRIAGNKDAQPVNHPNANAHERRIGEPDQYGVGVDECTYTAWAHGDGDAIVTANAAILFGIHISGTLTGTAVIRDGTTAGGVLIASTATDAAVGTTYDLKGVKCDSGIFIDDAATGGTITVFWRDQ